MELSIYWTQFAEDKLNDIFDYYKFNAGISAAENIVNGIIEVSFEIDKNPYGHQKKNYLMKEFRNIVT